VQFHPESAGGPLDTIEVCYYQMVTIAEELTMRCRMFTDFVNECRNPGTLSKGLDSRMNDPPSANSPL